MGQLTYVAFTWENGIKHFFTDLDDSKGVVRAIWTIDVNKAVVIASGNDIDAIHQILAKRGNRLVFIVPRELI